HALDARLGQRLAYILELERFDYRRNELHFLYTSVWSYSVVFVVVIPIAYSSRTKLFEMPNVRAKSAGPSPSPKFVNAGNFFWSEIVRASERSTPESSIV